MHFHWAANTAPNSVSVRQFGILCCTRCSMHAIQLVASSASHSMYSTTAPGYVAMRTLSVHLGLERPQSTKARCSLAFSREALQNAWRGTPCIGIGVRIFLSDRRTGDSGIHGGTCSTGVYPGCTTLLGCGGGYPEPGVRVTSGTGLTSGCKKREAG